MLRSHNSEGSSFFLPAAHHNNDQDHPDECALACRYAPLWSLISVLYAHTIDEFVSDDQLNTQALPECPAKGIHPKERRRYFHATPEEKKTYRRYHASELLGIEKGEQPPYEAFKNPEAHQKEVERLLRIIISFSDNKDTCDQEGIKYIARLYRYFCPGSGPFEQLSADAQEALTRFYFTFRGPVLDLAREVANCPYITETIINKKKD